MSKASDELLRLREECVLNQRTLSDRVPFLGSQAYWAIRNLVDDGPLADVPFHRTHLEVVELIERAAVAAMKEEGGI